MSEENEVTLNELDEIFKNFLKFREEFIQMETNLLNIWRKSLEEWGCENE